MEIYAKPWELRKNWLDLESYRHGERVLMAEEAVSTNAWRYKRSCLLGERWAIQCDGNVKAGVGGLIPMICSLR